MLLVVFLVLAMVFAGPPVALFAAILGFAFYDRLPGGKVVALAATVSVALVAYAAAVVLLFLAMLALGNAT